MKGKDGAKKTPFRSSLRKPLRPRRHTSGFSLNACEVRRETSTPGQNLIRRHGPGRLLASLKTLKGLQMRDFEKMLMNHPYTGWEEVLEHLRGRTEPRIPS